jgi:hypothetical protein
MRNGAPSQVRFSIVGQCSNPNPNPRLGKVKRRGKGAWQWGWERNTLGKDGKHV